MAQRVGRGLALRHGWLSAVVWAGANGWARADVWAARPDGGLHLS
jgi:hypothetical protein